MVDPVTIDPAVPIAPGLDFASLKRRGLALVHQLAGETWTDVNEHDPGLTTLEQLCYALTELTWLSQLPIADLLTGDDGTIDLKALGLSRPAAALAAAPLTVNDFRRLFIDRVSGVANAWLVPCPVAAPGDVDGLYDLLLHVPSAHGDNERADVVRRRARRWFSRRRSLCEDLRAVVILEPVRTLVSAVVEIDDQGLPEAVLARLLFNLEEALAPRVARKPIDDLLAAGARVETVFDGPAMRGGLIPDEALGPKPRSVAVEGLARVMADTEGVIRAPMLQVVLPSRARPFERGETIDIPHTGILKLDAIDDDGGFTIRLSRRGRLCRLQPERVEHELEILRRRRRNRGGVPAPAPRRAGRSLDLSAYALIQSQYPAAYGLGDRGLAGAVTPERRAQVRQLRGYLLVFEQLLADHLSHIAGARTLLSVEERAAPLQRSLRGLSADVDAILTEDYEAGLASLWPERATLDRRQRVLERLLALYGERLDADMLPPAARDARDPGERLLHARLTLLRHRAAFARRRGSGADYLGRPVARNDPGLVLRSRILLGWEARPEGQRPADGASDRPTSTDADAALDSLSDAFVAAHFAPLHLLAGHFGLGGRPSGGDASGGPSSPGRGYHVGAIGADGLLDVIYRNPETLGWRRLRRFESLAEAVAMVERLSPGRQGVGLSPAIHVIEHVLLRPASRDVGDAGAPDADGLVYGFTVTAVITDGPDELHDAAGRLAIETTIRRNTPPHVDIRCLHLDGTQARAFEALHDRWRQALRQETGRSALNIHAAPLRRFLNLALARQNPPEREIEAVAPDPVWVLDPVGPGEDQGEA